MNNKDNQYLRGEIYFADLGSTIGSEQYLLTQILLNAIIVTTKNKEKITKLMHYLRKGENIVVWCNS